MKVRSVRVFSATAGSAPVDIVDVVRTEVREGVYSVRCASGQTYRFPTALILYASESPLRRKEPSR